MADAMDRVSGAGDEVVDAAASVGVAVGMFALTVWMLIQGMFGYSWLSGSKLVVRKVSSLLRAVVYASIGVGGLSILTSGPAASSSSGTKHTSANLLALPGGPLWLALIGLGVAIAAADQI